MTATIIKVTKIPGKYELVFHRKLITKYLYLSAKADCPFTRYWAEGLANRKWHAMVGGRLSRANEKAA